MTHPAALARLRPDRLEVELVESKAVIEAALGAPVVGFRAPNWDLDRRLLDRLAEAGFSYDASTIPSPLLPLFRFAIAARSRRPGLALRLQLAPLTLLPGPRVYEVGSRIITEFPISVTRLTRLPIYHTMRSMIGDADLERHLEGLVRAGVGLDYAIHAVDAMGLVEDGVDVRLARHPGMNASLDWKLALLDRTVAAIAARFRTVPYCERVAVPAREASRARQATGSTVAPPRSADAPDQGPTVTTSWGGFVPSRLENCVVSLLPSEMARLYVPLPVTSLETSTSSQVPTVAAPRLAIGVPLMTGALFQVTPVSVQPPVTVYSRPALTLASVTRNRVWRPSPSRSRQRP